MKILLKNKIDYILQTCPKPIFNILYKLYHKKYTYRLDLCKMHRFANEFEKNKININKNTKYCLIKKGRWDYSFFNICFLNNMLGNIIYILSNDKIPIVDVKNKSENENIWEMFLEQPFVSNYKNIDIDDIDNVSICDIDESIFLPNFNSIYNEKELKMWCKSYKDFVVFNKRTKEYMDNEYNSLIPKNKRILGVLCRGTDYTTLKPKYHPIQPTVEMVIDMAKEKMKELNLDYIYLATEEKNIEDKFRKSFPDKVITNKRRYFDEKYYSDKNIKLIGQVHFDRENDNYYKGLEYLSSLSILSKCDVLIGGNCGGSCAALYMNNMKYEYTHIFNLGLYGIDDV